jgi:hypothetical protein
MPYRLLDLFPAGGVEFLLQLMDLTLLGGLKVLAVRH